MILYGEALLNLAAEPVAAAAVGVVGHVSGELGGGANAEGDPVIANGGWGGHQVP